MAPFSGTLCTGCGVGSIAGHHMTQSRVHGHHPPSRERTRILVGIPRTATRRNVRRASPPAGSIACARIMIALALSALSLVAHARFVCRDSLRRARSRKLPNLQPEQVDADSSRSAAAGTNHFDHGGHHESSTVTPARRRAAASRVHALLAKALRVSTQDCEAKTRSSWRDQVIPRIIDSVLASPWRACGSPVHVLTGASSDLDGARVA